MSRWQCPVYNGTLETFVWSSMNYILMFILLKADCGFSIKVTCKGNISELNTIEKRQYLPHYWTDKCFKGTVVNGTCRITWNYPYSPLNVWSYLAPHCPQEYGFSSSSVAWVLMWSLICPLKLLLHTLHLYIFFPSW